MDKERGVAKCDFCGKLVSKVKAVRSVELVGGFGDLEDVMEEIEHFYCSEQHKALYFYQEHLGFYGSQEEAFSHLEELHGLKNIRSVVRAYESGDPLPEVELEDLAEEELEE